VLQGFHAAGRAAGFCVSGPMRVGGDVAGSRLSTADARFRVQAVRFGLGGNVTKSWRETSSVCRIHDSERRSAKLIRWTQSGS